MPSSALVWGRQELMYCANVHPTLTPEQLIQVVEQFACNLKQQRALNSMLLGSWINEALLHELQRNEQQLIRWKTLLTQHNLRVKTLNAFPQAKFHGERIKEKVYLPDWSMSERLLYTQNLATFIAQHQDAFAQSVTVSTVPLGYKSTWSEAKSEQAANALLSLANFLQMLHQKTGVKIRVCLEMEPDCQLEFVEEAIDFFTRYLCIDENTTVKDYLGVCFDICHQSVMHEDITDSVDKLLQAGIVIGKVQVSSAIRIAGQLSPEQGDVLAPFQHSPYLHQVKIKSSDKLSAFQDLTVSELSFLGDMADTRIHLHVPIHLSVFAQGIETTQQQIKALLACLPNLGYKPDLEVETYTWGILNPDNKSENLVENLVKEINWLESEMQALNLMDNNNE